MIMPAMPAFYQMPKTLDDLADFMAGKILSALGFAHELYPSWKASVSHVRRARAVGESGRAPGTSTRRRRASPACSTRSRRATTCSITCSAPDSTSAGAPARSTRWSSPPGARVLDLCTGTGDLAVAAVRRVARRVGGRRRLRRRDAAARSRQGPRRSASTVGSGWSAATPRASRSPTRRATPRRSRFGIRNVAEPERALAELARVLRPRRPPGHPRVRPAADPGHPHAVLVVFPLSAAARRPARVEAPERVFVPAGVGRHLSAAG